MTHYPQTPHPRPVAVVRAHAGGTWCRGLRGRGERDSKVFPLLLFPTCSDDPRACGSHHQTGWGRKGKATRSAGSRRPRIFFHMHAAWHKDRAMGSGPALSGCKANIHYPSAGGQCESATPPADGLPGSHAGGRKGRRKWQTAQALLTGRAALGCTEAPARCRRCGAWPRWQGQFPRGSTSG